jgi:hypothetical protein
MIRFRRGIDSLEKAMSIEKSVLQKLLKLPVEKQKEVLDFVESLERETGQRRSRRSPKGLWADLGVDISAEDIAEARREMWGGFPREDV